MTFNLKKIPFDFDSAFEAVSTALELQYARWADMVSEEQKINQTLGCMSNCSDALRLVNKYGATEGVIKVFDDGKEGGFVDSIGLEGFDIKAIEGLGKDGVDDWSKKFVDKINKRLEDGQTLVAERIKSWKQKFFNTYEQILVGQAKLMKIVSESDFSGVEANKELGVAIGFEQAQNLLSELDKLGVAVKAMFLGDSKDSARMTKAVAAEAMTVLDQNGVVKEGTLESLGWSAENVDTVKSKFYDLVFNKELYQLGTDKVKECESVGDWRKADAGLPQVRLRSGQDAQEYRYRQVS
jgi:hypothetical protein